MNSLRHPLYIYAASRQTWPVTDQAPDLKPLIAELWGGKLRRLNHFIHLALAGAGHCARSVDARIAPQCELLFVSPGNIAQVISVSQRILRDRQPPMPFDFMNITNNMAPFYVAQALGLAGGGLTLAHRTLPFETALHLAMFQASQAGAAAQYLLGAVEECVFPLQHHRRQLGLPAQTPMAEASHWLWTGNAPANARARFTYCAFADSDAALAQCLAELPPARNLRLAFGFGVEAQAQAQIMQHFAAGTLNDYRGDTGYHATAPAGVAAAFSGGALLHINRTPQGRYALFVIESCD